MRIPAWAENAEIKINGEKATEKAIAGSYSSLTRIWKKGDVIELYLPMPVRLMEANPLVEETRNQVAVMRGPIVYCIESPDISDARIFDVKIPADIQLKAVKEAISGAQIAFLEGTALVQTDEDWNGDLYRPIDSKSELKELEIRLVPYFAWGNRGKSEMSVWIPLKK
ncbi:hypothetical protein LV83_01940 [Algoriphagus yeomjeoni]|uniref:Glycoside hydrolase family 127 protein n=1 Tax=Algoriphagus yeomjeoni TaxID=291403 RepID=A0A327PCK7_9BACT|nr:hypothetical protein LV83_01940 [Algoriphagus yeomjeoni]